MFTDDFSLFFSSLVSPISLPFSFSEFLQLSLPLLYNVRELILNGQAICEPVTNSMKHRNSYCIKYKFKIAVSKHMLD